MAKATGATILLIDYKRAPQFRHPIPDEDCLGVYRWLTERVDAQNLYIAGDSAGGALTVSTLVRARDAGLPLPRAGILYSPWVDFFDVDRASMHENVCFDYLPVGVIPAVANMYIDAGASRTFCGINLKLQNLPPLFVEYGDSEVLRDQIKIFIDRAISQNVDVQHKEYPDMVHVFQLFSFAGMKSCRDSYDHLRSFLNRLDNATSSVDHLTLTVIESDNQPGSLDETSIIIAVPTDEDHHEHVEATTPLSPGSRV